MRQRKLATLDQNGQKRSNLLDTGELRPRVAPNLTPNTLARTGFSRRSHTQLRWVMLLLAALASTSMTYCPLIPVALETAFTNGLGIDNLQYNAIFSAYSLPNMVLPLLGGVFIDYIGVTKSLMMFCALLFIGQTVMSIGVHYVSYELVLAGNFIFGLGGENASVAYMAILTQWFKGKEMGLALATNLSVGCLAQVFNNILSPMLEKNYSVEIAMWFGTALCIVCMGYSGVIWALDRRWVRQQKERGCLVEQTSTGEKIDLSRLSKDFHFIYWQLTAACFLVYGSIKPFQQICPAFFESRWGFSLQKAGLYLSILPTMLMVTAPLIGSMSDKYGKRITCMLTATVLVCAAHLVFIMTTVDPIIPMCLLGCGFALFASTMWPCVSLVVDESMEGTAFGLLTAVQNTGLFTLPLVVGTIQETGSYFWIEVMFFIMSCLGVILIIFMYREDKKTGGRMSLGTPEARAVNAKRFGTPTFEESSPILKTSPLVI